VQSSYKQRAGSSRDKRQRAGDLTAGDVARMLHVDLKTIHNWVRGGHVLARRTEGRHMRFHRAEVVRFLRRFGYPIPPALGAAAPRVLVHKARSDVSVAGALRTVRQGLFETILEVARGDYEVLVLDLDAFDRKSEGALVAAIRSRPETRCIYVVGMSGSPSRRRSFVRDNGDAAVARGNGHIIGRTARWLTGSVDEPPRGVLAREDYP
jgi:excisionase family DNA binding protein